MYVLFESELFSICHSQRLCSVHKKKKNCYFFFSPLLIKTHSQLCCWIIRCDLPESLRAAPERSGLLAITEVRLLGIGNDGFGLDCIAARACWTASCRTSKIKNYNESFYQKKRHFFFFFYHKTIVGNNVKL